MIVYGDHVCPTTIHALDARARAWLAQARATSPGLARHQALVAAFLAHAEMVRALADVAFGREGEDRPDTLVDAHMAVLVRLARAVAVSWDGRFRRTPVPDLGPPPPDAATTTKAAEGFAFYALYPEAVLEAARRLPPGRDWRVIGLRGIGVALAALAAAELRTCALPVTLRPIGHPFARRIATDTVASPPHALVVDEGPGLSGSSLAAAIRWLEQGGARPGSVTLLTSHPNPPGAIASPATRALWQRSARTSADFERDVLPRLTQWVQELLGARIVGWRDLGAGAWARGRAPTDPSRERRKYRVRTESGDYMVKFAGLGDIGLGKIVRARVLAAEGLVPEPIGLAHGFLVEPWITSARPAEPTHRQVARYLGARARLAPPNAGATLATLIAMAHANIGEALGAQAAAAFSVRSAGAERLPSRAVATDNRLHLWEWKRGSTGQLLKTDALDHCEGHDLVGCQDIAWDIAGAQVELGLDAGALGQALNADPDLVALHALLYPAFQLGLWTLAGHTRAGIYADVLAARLGGGPPPAVADH